MKKFSALLALAALPLIFAACTGPIAAQQDNIQIYPQVLMTTEWLANNTAVQPPVVTRTGVGQIQVAIPIYNKTNDQLSLDYQYRFLNHGAEVEGRSGWHNYVLPPRGTGEITFTSMVPNADDFSVEIRGRK